MTCYLYEISFTVKRYTEGVFHEQYYYIVPDNVYSFLRKNDFCIVSGADSIDNIISESEYIIKFNISSSVYYKDDIKLTLAGSNNFVNKLKLMA